MKTEPKDGAFPIVAGIDIYQKGLTKRELFAALIYAGQRGDYTCKDCVESADLLIEALNHADTSKD